MGNGEKFSKRETIALATLIPVALLIGTLATFVDQNVVHSRQIYSSHVRNVYHTKDATGVSTAYLNSGRLRESAHYANEALFYCLLTVHGAQDSGLFHSGLAMLEVCKSLAESKARLVALQLDDEY